MSNVFADGRDNYFDVMQEREDASLLDWGRFVHTEYIRLALEEEGEDAEPESSTYLWENSSSETLSE